LADFHQRSGENLNFINDKGCVFAFCDFFTFSQSFFDSCLVVFFDRICMFHQIRLGLMDHRFSLVLRFGELAAFLMLRRL